MASRAEQRRSTLLALGEAAVDLFEAKGPSVTTEEIAARAGVSRRTLHRWCDTKEDLAFVHPLLWLDVFTAALAEQNGVGDGVENEGGNEGQAKASQQLGNASLAIARHVDADPDPPRRAFLVAATHPELLRGFHSAYQRWVDVVAAESERAGVDPFEARVIASAVMGMVDAATRAWLIGEYDTFEGALTRGLDYISELLQRLDEH